MSTPFQSALGLMIRTARTDSHLSLKQVAGKTSGRIGHAQLSSYERGDRNINVENLSLLADLYSVEMSTLIPAATRLKQTTVTIDTARLEELTPELGGSLARWVKTADVTRMPYRPNIIEVEAAHLGYLALLHGMTLEVFLAHYSALGVLS